MQPQPPQDDPWLPWANTQPTDAPYPQGRGVPYRSVNAHLPAVPGPPVVYQPVPVAPPMAPYGQPGHPPPGYYPPPPLQPPVVVNVAPHPQMAVTKPYISPAWHAVNIIASLLTCVWTPVYLIMWYRKSRPTSVTTYR